MRLTCSPLSPVCLNRWAFMSHVSVRHAPSQPMYLMDGCAAPCFWPGMLTENSPPSHRAARFCPSQDLKLILLSSKDNTLEDTLAAAGSAIAASVNIPPTITSRIAFLLGQSGTFALSVSSLNQSCRSRSRAVNAHELARCGHDAIVKSRVQMLPGLQKEGLATPHQKPVSSPRTDCGVAAAPITPDWGALSRTEPE